MSVFGKQIRRVRDETLPGKTRLLALLVALDAFSLRTNQDAGAVLDRLGAALGFDRARRSSLPRALGAAAVLERERNTHVEHERGFARRRVREKAMGRRAVSGADRERWVSRAGFAPLPHAVRAAWGLLPAGVADPGAGVASGLGPDPSPPPVSIRPRMTEISVVTPIGAPPAVCFDLALDPDFHAASLAATGERVVACPAGRLLGPGDEVTFEGRHLGVRQRFTARIEAFDRPRHFRDVMTRGAFRSFFHDHHFEADGAGTRMVDRVRCSAPGGVLGVLVERLVLRAYLTRLLTERGQALKREAERRNDGDAER